MSLTVTVDGYTIDDDLLVEGISATCSEKKIFLDHLTSYGTKSRETNNFKKRLTEQYRRVSLFVSIPSSHSIFKRHMLMLN